MKNFKPRGLTNAVVFSALFSKPKYAAHFLNSTDLFNVDEKDLKTESKEFYENVNCKVSNMDVVMHIGNKNELINLEMQKRNTGYDIMSRLMFYLSRLISSSEERGDSYKCNKSTVVAIFDFTYFKDEKCIRTFKMKDEYANILEHNSIIVIELTKAKFCNKMNLKKWLEVFKIEDIENHQEEDEFMKDVIEEIKKFNADEQRQIDIIRQEVYEKDRLTELEYAKKQGIERGITEATLMIAKNMKAKGLANSIISEMTGLDENTIKDL